MGSLRAADPADADAVSALLARSYRPLMADAYDPAVLALALPMIIVAQPALLVSGHFFVAESPEGMIVGCGGWSHERPGSGGSEPGIGHIRHFATEPGLVRHGIGRRIADRCTAQARADRVQSLHCWASLNAVPFYKSLGFVQLGPHSVLIGDRASFPAVEMRLSI